MNFKLSLFLETVLWEEEKQGIFFFFLAKPFSLVNSTAPTPCKSKHSSVLRAACLDLFAKSNTINFVWVNIDQPSSLLLVFFLTKALGLNSKV